MSTIAPAILVDMPAAYEQYVRTLLPFARRVHIDITDEEFAPSKTVTLDDIWWPREWIADVHMMVNYPSRYAAKLVQMKPHLVIFHAEAKEPLLPTLRQLRAAGIKVAVGLLAPTHPRDARHEIEESDGAMIFSGDLGHYGGTANLLLLHKVRQIHDSNPHAEIGWDGGVNLDNARDLARGGVDVLNVGGCISRADDPHTAYQLLERAVKE